LKALRPNQRLLWLLLLWTLLALGPLWWPQLTGSWLAAGGLIALLAVFDARLPKPRISAERQVANILPVGVWSPVTVQLHNPQQQPLTAIVFDHYPQPADYRGLPRLVTLAGGGHAELKYRIRPLERGELQFGPLQLVLFSPLNLWRINQHLALPQSVRIYPNFANIARFALLAHTNRVAAMGIHQRRRRGEGQNFFQLREYRESDNLRQIDWKATARHRKLISKEYQDERDQPVMFLLDCSRRMRTRDSTLSHFDHALNAMILLSYVALRQGDAVGVHSFGGPGRRLAARKGHAMLNSVINTVYDLQPTLRPPDYSSAANQLMVRQRKRALVVMLTNLRDEDSDDLLPAIRLLSRRHLVLIANLRESVLDEVLEQPVDDFSQARLYAATCHYLAQRERTQDLLRRQGAMILDTKPQDLPVAMVNHYMDLKRSGRL
jgi:uncharacterized protein (DUF58 family)